MKIIIAPNKILNTKCKKVKKIDKNTHKLIKGMSKALIAHRDPIGVGLSAPQVDILSNIFIMRPEPEDKIQHFINPEIIEVDNKDKPELDTENENFLEGCLSIPKTWGFVDRDHRIKVKFLTLENEEEEQWYEGFESAVIQHEIDHLNGILFTQRSLEQGYPLYKEVGRRLEKI
jgi:peptide deformylase